MKTFLSIALLILSATAINQPAAAEEIPLRNVDGFYKAPVRLNGVVTLDFALDTGAADVSMSDDVVDALVKSGAMDKTDIRGLRTYMLADGSKIKCRALVIRKMQLGKQEALDVDGSTCPGKALLLLGQSFFKKLGVWSMDLSKNVMIVKAAAGEVPPAPVPQEMPPSESKPAVEKKSAAKAKRPEPLAAAAECDFDISKIVNGATQADANTIWSCKVGKEPYYVAPLQIFSDGTGIGYGAGSGKYSWRKTGCRSLAYNFNMGNQTLEATDIYGDSTYGTLTMTLNPNNPQTPPQNAVCVKQEGRVSEDAILKVQVVSQSKIDPSCKLLQKTEMKDDLILILNTSAQKGATHVAYGEKKGANVAVSMYQCELSGKESASLGAHAQSMGDPAKAEELYNKALAANPNDVDALNGLAVLYSQKGDLAKAQGLFEKILAINPNNVLVLGNLGMLYDAKGDLTKSQEMYEKALAIDPNDIPALDGLGVLYAKKGDLMKARALLEKVISINPNFSRTLYNLAKVYELQFDKTRAVEFYKKFLDSNPAGVPGEVLNQVRAHIAELEK